MATINPMLDRRPFLKHVAAVPFVGPLPAGAFWPDDFADSGVLRFEKVGPPEWFYVLMNRVNSKPWRGHNPGTVRMRTFRFDRLSADVDSQFRYGFEFVPAKPHLIRATIGPPMEISAATVYGTADFNDFDFGEVVSG